MPGPGGGSNSGGFGGGHDFGGSSSDSHFGSDFDRMHEGGSSSSYSPRLFWIWGPRITPGGWSGFFQTFLHIISSFLIFSLLWIYVILVACRLIYYSNAAHGGNYNEKRFQSYAIQRYGACYGTNRNESEDGVMLLFSLDEDRTGYYSIAIVGDHVQRDINELFGNENTAYGRTVLVDFNEEPYTDSISAKLVNVVDDMKTEVLAVKTNTGFTCSDDRTSLSPVFQNESGLTVDESLVGDALSDFTAATDIPLSLVVVNTDDIFVSDTEMGTTLYLFGEREINLPNSVLIIIGVAIISVAVITVIVHKREDENVKLRAGLGDKPDGEESDDFDE